LIIKIFIKGDVICNIGAQEVGDLLLTFLEQLGQFGSNSFTSVIVEGGGQTRLTDTSSTTDTMNVFIHIIGHIVVDDVHDVTDINTTGSDSSSDQNGALTTLEGEQSIFSFHLGTITVNGGRGETAFIEILIQTR
jgi:hypothetical protein